MKLFPLSTSRAECPWKHGRSFVAICLLAFFTGVVTAQTQTFMDEIRAVRAKSKTSDVEIHDIAAKYIPVGTHKETALTFCEANKFKIYPVARKDFDSGKYDEALYCDLDMTRWYLLGFGDVVRITMHMKDGTVADVKGFIFYQAW